MSHMIRFFALFAVFFVQSVSAAPDEGARDAVLAVVDQFKTKIVDQKKVLSKDPQRLYETVSGVLDPVIDFNDFAKKVMGKYYRRSSADQRSRFSSVTKATLINTYGTTLLDFDPSAIEVKPLASNQRGKETKVDVGFKTDDGTAIDIAFYMAQSKSGNWQLSNIIINGINFGLTFRKQFGVMMQKNKNNLDDAISAWESSLAAK
ncbi:MlaC/ttg2D family ABC transporter substrate-binding protein [Marinomonas mediterranea]|uniref:Toluene tolerance family protein n=1 Tax=Marinomonas mediterranea (strain ATCC 700492 / JCM 21426 / NBRC 103028 / MMB-1) TaxID=717774 RepID=F2K1A8_MARM1|nr:ABC transporter substrate-binding protein [Marinomonas mediterranea]ADZ91039.1 toluene tolerance family protein [Marinomonas mediterranea MMB-1]WCN09076.1 ABC transporter substrate-binding protein [Marinomonas mediterranea]WCN13107.1 ABC transporter substrate-binding protein [Marinomonas mediterranea]WCN17178.1 ABC transporter substrate-binding protein [Marinomonas mediterranea MMB-1]